MIQIARLGGLWRNSTVGTVVILVFLAVSVAFYPRSQSIASPPFLAGGESERAEAILTKYFDQVSDGGINLVSAGPNATNIARSSDLYRLSTGLKSQHIGNIWPLAFRPLGAGTSVSIVATPTHGTDLATTLHGAWQRVDSSGVLTSGSSNLSSGDLPREAGKALANKRKPSLNFDDVALAGSGTVRENGWWFFGPTYLLYVFIAFLLLAPLVRVVRQRSVKSLATFASYLALLIVPVTATELVSSALFHQHISLIASLVSTSIAMALVVVRLTAGSVLHHVGFTLTVVAIMAAVTHTLLGRQVALLLVSLQLLLLCIDGAVWNDDDKSPQEIKFVARLLWPWNRLVAWWPQVANRSILAPLAVAVLVGCLVMPAAQARLASPTFPGITGAGLKQLRNMNVQGLGEVYPLTLVINEGRNAGSDVIKQSSAFPDKAYKGCGDTRTPAEIPRCEALAKIAKKVAEKEQLQKAVKEDRSAGSQLSPLAQAISSLNKAIASNGRFQDIRSGGRKTNTKHTKIKEAVPYRITRITPLVFTQQTELDTAVSQLRKLIVPTAGLPNGASIMVGGMPAIAADYSAAARKELPLQMLVLLVASFLVSALFERSLTNGLVAAFFALVVTGAAIGGWRLLDGAFTFNAYFGGRDNHSIDAWIPLATLAIFAVVCRVLANISIDDAPGRLRIEEQHEWAARTKLAILWGPAIVAVISMISPLWPLRSFGVVLAFGCVFAGLAAVFALPYLRNRSLVFNRS